MLSTTTSSASAAPMPLRTTCKRSTTFPPHKFYLVGIGKDQQVASDSTAAGRAKNRRVEIKLMSNMSDSTTASAAGPNGQ